jgi:hypothetical protein
LLNQTKVQPLPDNNVDHCLENIRRRHCLDNSYYSDSDTAAIGTDYQHSIQCPSDAANANDFVVSNYRRRHYPMPRPTHDALKFLVVNTDASVDCLFVVADDFPSRQHFERALVLVVCQTYRVDSVMLSAKKNARVEKLGT